MRSIATSLASALVLAAMAVGTASAAGPDVFQFDIHDSFDAPVVSAACGFTVHRVDDGRGVEQDFADGSSSAHVTGTTVWTAGSRTVREHDAFTVAFDPDGEIVTVTGAYYHIVGQAQGSIDLAVGRIVFDADGDILWQGGPHPALDRDVDALCAALAP